MVGQETKFKKIINSKITLFLLLLAFIWLSVNVANVFYKKYQLAKQVASLQAEIEKAQKDNQQISAMIDYLGTQSFLEKQAREKLNLKKEGENVVIIEPSREQGGAATSSEILLNQLPEAKYNESQMNASTTVAEDSNLVKWWKYFFK